MAESKSEEGTFASDLGALLESGDGADVILVAGDSQLPAHSQVLSARSAVFSAMLRSGMREASSRRVEISDVRECVLRQVLSFIYTDTAPEMESVAVELFAAADKYGLPLLKQRCGEVLARDLSVENACATAALAVLHCCPGLESAAVQFIAQHPEVLATEGWAQLIRGSAEAAVKVSNQLAAHLRREPPEQTTEERVVFMDEEQKLGQRLASAAQHGRLAEVQELLATGAPVDGRSNFWNTALYCAVRNRRVDTVKCLLNEGADVTAENSCLQTPLHCAAASFDVKIMCMLIAASAPLDAKDTWGKTPLHWAAETNAAAVKALLLAGARKDIKNNYGMMPVNVAIPSTRELLLQ